MEDATTKTTVGQRPVVDAEVDHQAKQERQAPEIDEMRLEPEINKQSGDANRSSGKRRAARLSSAELGRMVDIEMAEGPVQHILDELDARPPKEALVGMALYVSAVRGVFLAIACDDCGRATVSIRLPDGVPVSQLRRALWGAPLPILILAILRHAAAKGMDVHQQGDRRIERYRSRFLEVLARAGSEEEFWTYMAFHA